MHISGMNASFRNDLYPGWQTSQVHEGALATWSFTEEYILKMLS